MQFAHKDDVTSGTKLLTDGGFTCMPEGAIKIVRSVSGPNGGLYVPCRDGKHFLDGQLDDDNRYVGLTITDGQP